MSVQKKIGLIAGISAIALSLLPAGEAAAAQKPVSRGYLTVCNHQGMGAKMKWCAPIIE